MAEHHAGHAGGGHVQTDETHHHVPLKHYWMVFGVLMVGLVLTVLAATQDFGSWNWFIAVAIAVIKASCIVAIFMHVAYSSRLVKLLAIGAYIWLMILFVEAGMDYISRLDPIGLTKSAGPSAITAPAAAGGHSEAGSGQHGAGRQAPSPEGGTSAGH
jgi:caa(3)-type oxidase subunit IV